MKDILLSVPVEALGMTLFDMLFYFIVPFVIMAVMYLVLNGMLLKKKVDMGLIIITTGIIIALQVFTSNFFRELLKTTQTHEMKFLFWTITDTTTSTYPISLVVAVVIDVICGFSSICFHNFMTDERTTSFSQGIRALIAPAIILCVCMFFAFKGGSVDPIQITKGITNDLNTGGSKSSSKIDVDLNKKDNTKSKK